MHPRAQGLLQFRKLRPHPLRHSFPPHLEIAFRVLSAIMREPKERKGCELCLVSPFPVSPNLPPELDQSRFVWMEFQTELRQPLLKLLQKPLGIGSMLESGHKIVSVSDNNHVAARHFLAPDLYPQIEHIVQIHVRQQR